MNVEIDNFVGIYRDVYPKGYCEHLIAEFERLTTNGAGTNRKVGEDALRHHKDDLQLEMNIGIHAITPFDGHDARIMFFNGLQACYENYIETFSTINDCQIRASAMKMQRTDPGGGYHVWHCEQGNGMHADRFLVYILYLNELGDKAGGETEFLYQRQRIIPEANTMLIWPAGFTHTHRGNTVLGDKSKYIVTGWFYYE